MLSGVILFKKKNKKILKWLTFGKQCLHKLNPGFQWRRAEWRQLQKFDFPLLHIQQVDTFFFANPRKENEFWMETQFLSESLTLAYFAIQKICIFPHFFITSLRWKMWCQSPPASHFPLEYSCQLAVAFSAAANIFYC